MDNEYNDKDYDGGDEPIILSDIENGQDYFTRWVDGYPEKVWVNSDSSLREEV